MTERVPLAEQITALENVVLSKQAWLGQAKEPKSKASPYEITCTELWLPGLVAALETLRHLQTNRDALRAFIIAQRRGPTGKLEAAE